jgi:sporulation protein YqfC
MKERKNVMQNLANAADLAGELLPGETLLELFGNKRVLIEHHCGVSEYTPCTIRVKTKKGYLCVHGTHLELCKMSAQQLVIIGSIETISILKGG